MARARYYASRCSLHIPPKVIICAAYWLSTSSADTALTTVRHGYKIIGAGISRHRIETGIIFLPGDLGRHKIAQREITLFFISLLLPQHGEGATIHHHIMHDYFIEDTYEAGIVLTGTEIKPCDLVTSPWFKSSATVLSSIA